MPLELGLSYLACNMYSPVFPGISKTNQVAVKKIRALFSNKEQSK